MIEQQTLVGEMIDLAYGRSLSADNRRAGSVPVYGSNGLVGHHDNSAVDGPGIIVGRKGSVGALAYSDRPFWPIDTTYYVVNKGAHDWRFLFHLLRSLGLGGLNSHSAVPGLNREDVYVIPVGLPPREHEPLIGMTLDAVDVATNHEQSMIAALQALKRATMRELFTRGLRAEVQKDSELGLVPESWELVRIDGLGQVVTGNTPPTKDRSSYEGGDIPFIAPGDIEHGMRTNSAEKHVTRSGMKSSRPLPKGSTCFVCIGSTIGKVGMTTADISCTNQQINSVIPYDEFDPGFVFHLLTYWSDHIRKERSPSPVPIMSKGVFEKIEIWATRNKDEQQEISAILDAIDAKIILHKRKKAVVEELFQALLHKLMTGEVRITDLDLSAFNQPVNEAAA